MKRLLLVAAVVVSCALPRAITVVSDLDPATGVERQYDAGTDAGCRSGLDGGVASCDLNHG